MKQVIGTIISCERDDESGCMVGVVECPQCGEHVGIRPFGPKPWDGCRCNLRWQLEVTAIGYSDEAE